MVTATRVRSGPAAARSIKLNPEERLWIDANVVLAILPISEENRA